MRIACKAVSRAAGYLEVIQDYDEHSGERTGDIELL
jgi:hypothetical protein